MEDTYFDLAGVQFGKLKAIEASKKIYSEDSIELEITNKTSETCDDEKIVGFGSTEKEESYHRKRWIVNSQVEYFVEEEQEWFKYQIKKIFTNDNGEEELQIIPVFDVKDEESGFKNTTTTSKAEDAQNSEGVQISIMEESGIAPTSDLKQLPNLTRACVVRSSENIRPYFETEKTN